MSVQSAAEKAAWEAYCEASQQRRDAWARAENPACAQDVWQAYMNAADEAHKAFKKWTAILDGPK